VNKAESWYAFKTKHPKMLEDALGPQVSQAFHTIQKSGILNRFGANANAAQNFEALIELFAQKAHEAGWNDRENESLTKVITNETECSPSGSQNKT
jgi:hypothetical protein